MFMGTVSLVAKKLASNDEGFFAKFTAVRAELEKLLITHNDLTATILQCHFSGKRIEQYSVMLDHRRDH